MLKIIPDSIAKIQSLKYLVLDSNKLTSIPSQIGNLQLLKLLSISYNELTSIPPEIGNLSSLKYLYLESAFCPKSTEIIIPSEFANLHSLKEMNVRGNSKLRSKSIPPELYSHCKFYHSESYGKFYDSSHSSDSSDSSDDDFDGVEYGIDDREFYYFHESEDYSDE